MSKLIHLPKQNKIELQISDDGGKSWHDYAKYFYEKKLPSRFWETIDFDDVIVRVIKNGKIITQLPKKNC